MHCHLCDREAVDRCYTCGELFCDEHGRVNCNRCATAITAEDARPDRVSEARLSKTPAGRPGWWRPQPAENYDPPACHECRGLARYVCVQCGSRYCRDHAGKQGMCAQCQRSLRGGNLFLLILALVLGGMVLWGLFRAGGL
jgi:hypothetical protein